MNGLLMLHESLGGKSTEERSREIVQCVQKIENQPEEQNDEDSTGRTSFDAYALVTLTLMRFVSYISGKPVLYSSICHC